MSGILATTRSVKSAQLRGALGALVPLGGDEHGVWSHDESLIAVTRKRWELENDFSGNALVHETHGLVIGADASLYHRGELAAALAATGVMANGSSASHLIAAAYRAWGPSLIDHLSGDYAFVIWDIARQRLLAARDPLGSRPLFYARLGRGLAVASSSRAVAELVDGASDLNLANLGTQVAGLAWSIGSDSAYSKVLPLAPGCLLLHQNGATTVERFWSPPTAPDQYPAPQDEAAEELRALLSDAVSARLAHDTTSVWMSGGYDSTAVFAAGQAALAPSERARLRPVSISYPVGDMGREDDLIESVARKWNADIHWRQSSAIPLLDGLVARAAQCDEPPAHLYELWNCDLARGTRAIGSRIALDGGGGDQLFQVSDIVLADRLRDGNLVEFARLARSRRARGWRHLLRAGVLPLIPESVVGAAERWAGRTLPHHYLERTLADWVRPDFVATQNLRERELAMLRPLVGKSLAHAESIMYLTMPVWSHGASFMRGALLREGIEARSPMLDMKVVEFALRRPISERANATDTKSLLRRSMHGLLPDEVLAPRKYRTGMTLSFSRRHMRESYPGLFAALFAEPLRLADLGIVDPARLRAAADRCTAGTGDESLRVNLFHTMKVEFWLRGHDAHVVAPIADRSVHHAFAQVPAA